MVRIKNKSKEKKMTNKDLEIRVQQRQREGAKVGTLCLDILKKTKDRYKTRSVTYRELKISMFCTENDIWADTYSLDVTYRDECVLDVVTNGYIEDINSREVKSYVPGAWMKLLEVLHSKKNVLSNREIEEIKREKERIENLKRRFGIND